MYKKIIALALISFAISFNSLSMEDTNFVGMMDVCKHADILDIDTKLEMLKDCLEDIQFIIADYEKSIALYGNGPYHIKAKCLIQTIILKYGKLLQKIKKILDNKAIPKDLFQRIYAFYKFLYNDIINPWQNLDDDEKYENTDSLIEQLNSFSFDFNFEEDIEDEELNVEYIDEEKDSDCSETEKSTEELDILQQEITDADKSVMPEQLISPRTTRFYASKKILPQIGIFLSGVLCTSLVYKFLNRSNPKTN